MTKTLRVILGDQLTPSITSLDGGGENDLVLLAEVRSEATYVPHHRKKIAFVFSAMRHFAEELRGAGWAVRYVRLGDRGNTGSLQGEVARAVRKHRAERIVVTEPGEWRVLRDVEGWEPACGVPVEVREDGRFFATRERFAEWARGRRSLRMEYFYREMRREHGLLLEEDGKPTGGKWNYDVENRKALPAGVTPPPPLRFEPDEGTREVLRLVGRRFRDHFGDLEPFWFAVTRAQAEEAFEHFVEHALPSFGDYQDAMKSGERFLFHSVVSYALNAGLLDPRAVCRRVEKAYRKGAAPIAAAEGFIRQVLGWREYVRGLYWLRMPGYARTNHLRARRPLPAFYWSGETPMRCVREAVAQTREEAYAHHIQRLMVTGNFALLAGLAPAEVCEWYLAVYADAYEWVELPNTHGMALFADGGILGSKPYAASGKYIDRMSDYCKGCELDVRRREGEGACPFNFLYWDFLARHRRRLEGNARMGLVLKALDSMDPSEVRRIRRQAKAFLAALD